MLTRSRSRSWRTRWSSPARRRPGTTSPARVGADERTRSAIYTTARTVIEAWSDPVVARAAQGCDITPDWLLKGDNTLYIVAPARDQARFRPVFASLVADRSPCIASWASAVAAFSASRSAVNWARSSTNSDRVRSAWARTSSRGWTIA